MRLTRGDERGYSLIELLACIALISVALVVAWDLWDESLVLMGNAGRSATDESFCETAIHLRSDLQAAASYPHSATWTSESLVVLRSDGMKVSYVANENGLLRCQQRENDAAEICRRELRSLASWKWRSIDDGLLELRIERWTHSDPLISTSGTKARENRAQIRRLEVIRIAARATDGGLTW